MDKQTIINQIAVLRQSGKQLENMVQKILSYCDSMNERLEKESINWGMVALPVMAEEIGVYALTCVKRAVKLDTLLMLASEEEMKEPEGFGSAPQSL